MAALYWSVRRELWENRSIYLAPLAVAGLFLIGFAVTAAHPAPARIGGADAGPYEMAEALVMLTAVIVGVFYCLDALYGERRDRSTLFWKSMPVSDLTTVIAKAIVPVLLLPLLTFAITIALQSVMLLMQSAVLVGRGGSVMTLWSQVQLSRTSMLLLYHLILVHGIAYAPFYAWMLLVSAWAPRAPWLWAFLPPVALGFLEKLTLNTMYFFSLLNDRLSGNEAAMTMPGTFPTAPMSHPTPGVFLLTPGVWIGLGLAAVFLLAAARLRRSRRLI